MRPQPRRAGGAVERGAERRAAGAGRRDRRGAGGAARGGVQACRYITEQYGKAFYMGTKFFSPKQRAVCAVYAWCRRTTTVEARGHVRLRTESPTGGDERRVWEGKSYDDRPRAVDTVNYPTSIEPFEDMIKARRRRARRRAAAAAQTAPRPSPRNSPTGRGAPRRPPLFRAPTIARAQGMVMDLDQNRFETFDELYLYCYRVGHRRPDDADHGHAEEYTYEEARTRAAPAWRQLTNILATWARTARAADLPAAGRAPKVRRDRGDLLKGMKTEYVQLVKWQIDRARDWCAPPAPPARPPFPLPLAPPASRRPRSAGRRLRAPPATAATPRRPHHHPHTPSPPPSPPCARRYRKAESGIRCSRPTPAPSAPPSKCAATRRHRRPEPPPPPPPPRRLALPPPPTPTTPTASRYSKILNKIEANNFTTTKRAYTTKAEKLAMIPGLAKSYKNARGGGGGAKGGEGAHTATAG